MLEDRLFYAFPHELSTVSILRDYSAAIIENISDAIFLLDTNGRIVDSNRRARELLGIDRKDLIGQFIDRFIADNQGDGECSQPHRTQRLIENLRRGVYDEIEAALIHDGCVTPVVVSFGLVSNAAGDVQFIIVSAKDISTIKALERELKQQQIMAISRDRLRSLGELSAGLIHEMGQPLSTLKLSTEIAQQMIRQGNPCPRRIEEKLTDMVQLIERMSSTIHSIRTFARQVEDHSLSLVSIDYCIKNALSLVLHDLKQRGIEVMVKNGNSTPCVVANPVTLEQVVVNLLTNARDAFDEHEMRGNVSPDWVKRVVVTSSIVESRWAEIVVEDNAGGIDKAIRDKVFDPFFTTKEEGKGTGLGLSIVYGIVTKLGGNVQLDVKDGMGSMFRVRIPIRRERKRDASIDMGCSAHREKQDHVMESWVRSAGFRAGRSGRSSGWDNHVTARL